MMISNFDEIKESKYGIRLLIWLINPNAKICLTNEISKIITFEDLNNVSTKLNILFILKICVMFIEIERK